jgi:hypothetical protein
MLEKRKKKGRRANERALNCSPCDKMQCTTFVSLHGKGDVAPGVRTWIRCVSGQPQWGVGTRRNEVRVCSSDISQEESESTEPAE